MGVAPFRSYLGILAVAAALTLPMPAAAQAGAPDCAGRAGLYAGGRGLKLWVTRAGTLLDEDALRPLTPRTLVVLDVVVNGRAATAFGPDLMNLRQGAPADRLQAGAPEPIRWRPAGDGLPAEIRVVAEDGRVLFDQIRFAECGDAPKPAPAPAPAARRPDRPAGPRTAPTEGRDNPRLPQGAIPEGGRL